MQLLVMGATVELGGVGGWAVALRDRSSPVHRGGTQNGHAFSAQRGVESHLQTKQPPDFPRTPPPGPTRCRCTRHA